MGRQIAFHMMDEDKLQFFEFLSTKYDLVIANWTSNSEEVVPCVSPLEVPGSLAIWVRDPDRLMIRKRIEREDGTICFEFDRRVSILEFDPCSVVRRNEKDALLQGRLYSFLTTVETKLHTDSQDLYSTASRWIRRHFEPNPFKLLGGYIGSSAMRWYQHGGVLLPSFSPPTSSAWEQFVLSQH